MNRLNRLHAEQQEVCSSIWGQKLRRRGHQTESSSVLQEDRIYPSIEVVAPKRTNASPYNSRAGTKVYINSGMVRQYMAKIVIKNSYEKLEKKIMQCTMQLMKREGRRSEEH